MQLVDPRRLTGPNHLSRSPLVIVELALDAEGDRAHAREAYLRELGRLRAALGFPASVTGVLERTHRGGTVIAYAEPIDVMLACTEMSEWAAFSACEVLSGRAPFPLEPKRSEIEAMLARDRSPRLLALEAESARRNVPFFWDDERVSVGMGRDSVSWARGELPTTSEVPWERLGRIPIALVTGTNGKTTSTRLLARIAREAGKRVGSTSSDAIMIGSDVIEEGDWTGPAAARVVLQRTDVDFAVLETARGGILRRGLAVDFCDVALITNISDDHVGSYGIDDLDAMAQVKGVTVEALHPSGAAVLNASDPRLVALAGRAGRVIFFADLEDTRSESPAARVIADHRANGGEVVFAAGGTIRRAIGKTETEIARVDEIPLTFEGAARFNVENVLGVVAAAFALGLPEDAIVRAIETFTPDQNPRRSALVEKGGARIFLDFGHNADGVRAVMKLVASLRSEPKGKLTIIAGSAGDRSDRELAEIARAIHEARPDRLIVRELPKYLRGRAPGEVPEVLRRSFVSFGIPLHAIEPANVSSEVDALRLALATAQPGDFIVVLVHLEHGEVRSFLAS